MPRLGYRKVRTGCIRCRQRRVKCDEKRPCSACSRHGVSCSLMDTSIPRDNPLSRRKPTSRGQIEDPPARKLSLVPLRPREDGCQRNGIPQSPLSDDPFPYLANLVKTPTSASSESWTSDLELMHHFTTVTWKTLPRGPELSEIWQLELPKMSFKYPFLAHQILSFSANHMALLHLEQRNAYSIKASQHQSEAVKGLREALHTIDSSLCHAVFAQASLLSINTFASLSEQAGMGNHPGIDDLLHVLLLIRGMSGILESYESIIKQGPLGKLLQLGKYQSASPLLLEIIRDLESMTIPLDTRPSMPASCEEGIASLIEWIKHARQTASLAELRVIMSWPTRISDEFVHLVRERFGPALQVMDCYCRILESMGFDHWYLRGWGRSVREDITRVLA